MDSSLAAKRLPICTPLAPSFRSSATSAPQTAPPAAITGIFTALIISGRIVLIDSCVPRWPPASVPSTTIAEAPSFSEILASFTEETIGTTATL